MPTSGSATLVESMQVLARQVVALGAVPAGTFSARPASSGATRVPPQGTQPSLERLSVAQALAVHGMPQLLLSRPVGGLRLQHIVATQAPGEGSLTYLYHVPASVETFAVQLSRTDRGGRRAPLAPRGAPSMTLSTTIAGQEVRAVYATAAVGGALVQTLAYRQGSVTVRLLGTGLSRAQFLAAAHGLTSGRPDAALVARLEAELGG